MILATKVHGKMGEGPNEQGGSRYHILRACEDSLRRLQTDYIDLYQLHRPPLAIPPDETLRAFDDLVRSGKVLYIGCSTHPAWMVMEALAASDRHGLARYVSEQPPYNLLDRRIENELIPLCVKYGLAILPGRRSRAGSWPDATTPGATSRRTPAPPLGGQVHAPPESARRRGGRARRRDGPRARHDRRRSSPSSGSRTSRP